MTLLADGSGAISRELTPPSEISVACCFASLARQLASERFRIAV